MRSGKLRASGKHGNNSDDGQLPERESEFHGVSFSLFSLHQWNIRGAETHTSAFSFF
jgi:hypothetical protein